MVYSQIPSEKQNTVLQKKKLLHCSENCHLPWPASALVVGVPSILHLLQTVSYDLQSDYALLYDLKVGMNSVEAVVLSARAGFCNTYSRFYRGNLLPLGACGSR
jgi:hypothetical protein